MAKANARNTSVAYVKEVTPGTTPATPVFKLLRVTGESLEVQRKLGYSKELDGRRGEKFQGVLAKSGGGSWDFELSYTTFDDLLDGLFRNAWSTNVLTEGTTQSAYTLETRFETGATDIFKRLTGAEIESMSFSIKAAEVVTGTFEFMSRDSVYANAIVAGATYTAVTTTPVHTAADVGNLTVAGVTVGCVPQIDVSFKNNFDPNYCIGSLPATDMTPGTLEVTGTLSVILTEDELDVLTAAADGTVVGISFEIGKAGGSKYRFEIPSIVLDNIKVAAESAEGGTVLINAPFRGIQSSTLSGGVARVTRAV